MTLADRARTEMNEAMEHLHGELQNIRTGRANPAILDAVMVETYGTQMRLKDLASVSAPEARQLLVTPFDANNVDAVGKGIEKANLGFQIIVDGNVVRIIIPPMDEATRKEMVKQAKRKCEEGKVSVRNIRRKYNDLARKLKADGEITEDILKKEEKNIQKLTDEFCGDADKRASAKEEEILRI